MLQLSSRQAPNNQLPLLSHLSSPQQQLCVHGQLLKVRKMRQQTQERQLQMKEYRKKSHQSLGIGLQMSIQKANQRIKERRQPIKTEALKEVEKEREKNKFFNEQQEKKETDVLADKEIQEKSEEERKQSKFQFSQKKMKIGCKKKSDFMKQFILQILSKGKVEGNCITIDKGTAQVKHSPSKNLQIPPKNKQKHPLPQQQSSRVPQRRLAPLNQPKSRMANNSQSKALVRMGANIQSSRWVTMVRRWQQGKHPNVRQEVKNEQKERQSNKRIIQ